MVKTYLFRGKNLLQKDILNTYRDLRVVISHLRKEGSKASEIFGNWQNRKNLGQKRVKIRKMYPFLPNHPVFCVEKWFIQFTTWHIYGATFSSLVSNWGHQQPRRPLKANLTIMQMRLSRWTISQPFLTPYFLLWFWSTCRKLTTSDD